MIMRTRLITLQLPSSSAWDFLNSFESYKKYHVSCMSEESKASIKNIISLIIGNSSWLIGKDNSSLLTLLLKPKSVIFGCMLSQNGGLSLKVAYFFLFPKANHVHWEKFIWNKSIPPLKSVVFWWAIQNKFPADDNLWKRGIIPTSVCANFNCAYEFIHHLFLSCPFVLEIWDWLRNILGCFLNLSSMQNLLSFCFQKRAPQVQDVVLVAITFSIFNIWVRRNTINFEGHHLPFKDIIMKVTTTFHIVGSISSRTMSKSIEDFNFLKRFLAMKHRH
ncbi:hypothetical protein JHK82_052525 [Glycine max]|nr:hypothetical protein JHK84_052411 [Glycine max]KAG5085128.1 hypothetical protein JHK82_052525 [Glycine max]